MDWSSNNSETTWSWNTNKTKRKKIWHWSPWATSTPRSSWSTPSGSQEINKSTSTGLPSSSPTSRSPWLFRLLRKRTQRMQRTLILKFNLNLQTLQSLILIQCRWSWQMIPKTKSLKNNWMNLSRTYSRCSHPLVRLPWSTSSLPTMRGSRQSQSIHGPFQFGKMSTSTCSQWFTRAVKPSKFISMASSKSQKTLWKWRTTLSSSRKTPRCQRSSGPIPKGTSFGSTSLPSTQSCK